MDFVVRPQSKIDPDEIRARAKQVVQDQRRLKVSASLFSIKLSWFYDLEKVPWLTKPKGIFILNCTFSSQNP